MGALHPARELGLEVHGARCLVLAQRGLDAVGVGTVRDQLPAPPPGVLNGCLGQLGDDGGPGDLARGLGVLHGGGQRCTASWSRAVAAAASSHPTGATLCIPSILGQRAIGDLARLTP